MHLGKLGSEHKHCGWRHKHNDNIEILLSVERSVFEELGRANPAPAPPVEPPKVTKPQQSAALTAREESSFRFFQNGKLIAGDKAICLQGEWHNVEQHKGKWHGLKLGPIGEASTFTFVGPHHHMQIRFADDTKYGIEIPHRDLDKAPNHMGLWGTDGDPDGLHMCTYCLNEDNTISPVHIHCGDKNGYQDPNRVIGFDGDRLNIVRRDDKERKPLFFTTPVVSHVLGRSWGMF